MLSRGTVAFLQPRIMHPCPLAASWGRPQGGWHNPPSKTNGKRVTVRRCDKPAHDFGLKFRRGFKRAGEGAPKVFRSRKNTKVHHGNLQGGTRLRGCCNG